MERSIALDVLRGVTVAAMILVNTPGSWEYVYAPLSHATWHGCTPTDLIFPFFLFIVGSAMYFSLGNVQPSQALIFKIARRSLTILGLGLAMHLYASGAFDTLRIMGVLQRIGIVYGIAACIVLYSNQLVNWLIIGLIGLLYWAGLILFGSETPFAIEGNIVRSVDMVLLGQSHMWNINGIAFDPEGLLSTIPSVINVLLGFEATRILKQNAQLSRGALALTLLGGGLTLFGWLWGYLLPINKSLWSSSYAIFTSGIAVLTLSGLIWLIDIKKQHWLGKPFHFFGKNPLFIYILSWIWAVTYFKIGMADGNSLYSWLYLQLNSVVTDPYFASFSYALIHVMFFWLIAYELSRRKIFIKI